MIETSQHPGVYGPRPCARAAAWAGLLLLILLAGACASSQKELAPGGASPVPLHDITATDGGPIETLPALVKYSPPEYPQEAIFEGMSGTVEMAADVDEDGRVTQVRVVRSLPIFDIPCIEAMQSWRFSPALRAGRPVAFTVRVPFTFRVH